MRRATTIEIHKDELRFSAGHFTIFSATEREPLHGHNYSVGIAFGSIVDETGLSFDYRHYKKIIQQLCDKLNSHFLLPLHSPYLKIEEQEDYVMAHFNTQKIPFLKTDVVLLPLSNITIEELAHWFLQQLLENQTALTRDNIFNICVNVYNGPGQSGKAVWLKHGTPLAE